MYKKIIISIIVFMLFIGIILSSVSAYYQSVETDNKIRNVEQTWLINIRKMEENGQVMGLDETISSKATLLPNGTNNIDVHMQKNTEYGAMLILAISDYGKQGDGINKYTEYLQDSSYGLATSTGNKFGVYDVKNEQWTAAGNRCYFEKYFSTSGNDNIFIKYANEYNYTGKRRDGDAKDLINWQKGGYVASTDITNNTSNLNLGRNAGNVPFAIYARDGSSDSSQTRACIVNGDNI